jgi:hypothetical protein
MRVWPSLVGVVGVAICRCGCPVGVVEAPKVTRREECYPFFLWSFGDLKDARHGAKLHPFPVLILVRLLRAPNGVPTRTGLLGAFATAGHNRGILSWGSLESKE